VFSLDHDQAHPRPLLNLIMSCRSLLDHERCLLMMIIDAYPLSISLFITYSFVMHSFVMHCVVYSLRVVLPDSLALACHPFDSTCCLAEPHGYVHTCALHLAHLAITVRQIQRAADAHTHTCHVHASASCIAHPPRLPYTPHIDGPGTAMPLPYGT